MVLERKKDGNFENKKSDDSTDLWSETIGSKKQQGVVKEYTCDQAKWQGVLKTLII